MRYGRKIPELRVLDQPIGYYDQIVSVQNSDKYHDFSWLKSLDDAPRDKQKQACLAMMEWLKNNQQPSHHHIVSIWSAPIIATRIAYWCEYLKIIQQHLSIDDFHIFYQSLYHQYRFLQFHEGFDCDVSEKTYIILQLLFISLTLRDTKNSDKYARLTEQYLKQILHSDGMVRNRNAAYLVDYLSLLILSMQLLQQYGEPVYDSLIVFLDSMTSALRFFIYDDGKMACFQSNGEGNGAALTHLLQYCPAQATMPSRLVYSYFERLNAGKLSLLVDIGDSQLKPKYASTFSFELTHGKNRIFVNCGNHKNTDKDWQSLAANTAAHNSLTINDYNCHSTVNSLFFWRNRDNHALTKRQSSKEGEWLIMEHDGYRKITGHIHKRQLFLAYNGLEMRGCDMLYNGNKSSFAVVRFHLHPNCEVAFLADNKRIMIKHQQQAYHFICDDFDMAIEPSIYAGDGQFHQTKQIIITAPIGKQDCSIYWALKILSH